MTSAEYQQAIKTTAEIITQISDENKRLREVLEFYAEGGADRGEKAREVLR